MLTLDQIIDLQGKGFTNEQLQILSLMDMSAPEKKEPEKKEPDPEKKEPEPEKKDPAPEPEKKEPEPDDERVKSLESQIATLTETIKGMQTENAKSAKMEPEPTKTVEDIITSFMEAS